MFGGGRFVYKERKKSEGTDGAARVRRVVHLLVHQKLADALLLGE
jgi:hypothetical protein